MRKSTIFLYFSCCFIFGIAVRSFFNFDIFYIFIFLVICLVWSIIIKNNKKYHIIFLGAIFLFLGILRFEISNCLSVFSKKSNQNILSYFCDIRSQQFYQKLAMADKLPVEFIGKIVDEPDIRETHTKLTIGNIIIEMPNQNIFVIIRGKILVNAYKFSDFNYGDWVKIRCQLEKPDVIESDNGKDFDYGKYLSVKGIYSVCYKPEFVEKISEHGLNGSYFHRNDILTRIITDEFYKFILNTKQKFKIIIDQNLPLPQSGLLNAMLLGYRRELSQELIDNFSKTGVSHLIAISGLHITVIAGILFSLFLAFGMPRNKTFWLIILILFLYVLMIGSMASAVRALIMGAVLMYALKIGRLSKSLNSLILAAVILLIINPKLLIFDVGFQLSFLAVLGILWLYPVFSKWLNLHTDGSAFIPVGTMADKCRYKHRLTHILAEWFDKWICPMICLTLSAQVLTTPLVIYYFSRISLISPITNLLILPVLPLVMTGGIILIVFGLIWSKLAFVFGLFFYWVLDYVIWVTIILAKIPFAFF